MSFFTSVRSITVCLLMAVSAYLGSLFWQGPFLILAKINPYWYRFWMDITTASWMTFAGACLELIGGIKLKHFGDMIRSNERSIFIMNHRTRLDWLYLWGILVRCRCCRQEKIVLKHGLNLIPGFGWAMQCASFIFLKRNWEQDRENINDYLEYFLRLNHKCQILIFPEGTNLTANTKAKSDKFATDNNVEKYTQVLHPRTKGFVSIVEQIRKGKLDSVYDITIAYPENFPENEPEFLCGNIPNQVHIHVKRYDNSDLRPDRSDDDAVRQKRNFLSDWLESIWKEKECKLESYYALSEIQRRSNSNFSDPTLICNDGFFYYLMTIFYWLAFIVLAIKLILFSNIVFTLFIILNIQFLCITYFYGGIDKLAVNLLLNRST